MCDLINKMIMNIEGPDMRNNLYEVILFINLVCAVYFCSMYCTNPSCKSKIMMIDCAIYQFIVDSGKRRLYFSYYEENVT